MLREIVLDTETTGLDARNGDRLIELGCVELVNRIPTGQEFHRLIHPETRAIHPDAEAVHGISMQQLEGKPLFRDVVDDFLAFIGEAPLVIHNAAFDVGFINMELEKVGKPPIQTTRVVDTLMLARRKHPGGANSLDALCQRYGVDNSKRIKHGAVMDSLLLASVYVELLGERQTALVLENRSSASRETTAEKKTISVRPAPLPRRLSQEQRDVHCEFLAKLGDNAVWRKYL
jgi:DNA polymerase-3 subunit epsilon